MDERGEQPSTVEDARDVLDVIFQDNKVKENISTPVTMKIQKCLASCATTVSHVACTVLFHSFFFPSLSCL